MKRIELLKPGEYAGTPLAVLARRDLTPTAKTVYTALVSHLSNGNEWVWPSVARLSEMTAAGRSAVKNAIHSLAHVGLIEVVQRPGQSAWYRFLNPSGSESDPQETKEPQATGLDYDPHQVRNQPAPGQNPTHTGPESDHELLKELNQELNQEPSPPSPPQAGGNASGNFSPDPIRKITDRINAAHIEAFGRPLPAKWKRDIRDEINNGDGESLDRIDAAAILAAEKYRRKNGWSCLGHGTVMQYLANAARQLAEMAQKDAAVKAATAKMQAQASAEAQARKRQAQAEAFFRNLTPYEQDEWFKRARAMPFAPITRPDLIAAQAASMAFTERESLTFA